MHRRKNLIPDSPEKNSHSTIEMLFARYKLLIASSSPNSILQSAALKPDRDVRRRLRTNLNLSNEAIVVLFLGRLTRDKGVLDLAKAFSRVATDNIDVQLLVVGPDEECLTPALQSELSSCANRVRFVGMTDRPEDYMAAADIFCLPSYREGFGSVVIEAAAAGLPAVASRIYGLTDAVDDGETGVLHAPADIASIESSLRVLVQDADLRFQMGVKARERALTRFSSERVVAAQMAFYEDLLGFGQAKEV